MSAMPPNGSLEDAITPAGCRQKTANGNSFETEEEARRVARRMSKKLMVCIMQFHCSHCAKWHCGGLFQGGTHDSVR